MDLAIPGLDVLQQAWPVQKRLGHYRDDPEGDCQGWRKKGKKGTEVIKRIKGSGSISNVL